MEKIFKVHYAVTVYKNNNPVEGQGGFLTTYAETSKDAKNKVQKHLVKKYKKCEKVDLKVHSAKLFKVDVK